MVCGEKLVRVNVISHKKFEESFKDDIAVWPVTLTGCRKKIRWRGGRASRSLLHLKNSIELLEKKIEKDHSM